MKELFFLALKNELIKKFDVNSSRIDRYYRGNKFGKDIGMDIIILTTQSEKEAMEQLKSEISEVFRNYWIESVSVVFMTSEERERRYRLADRFVLNVMRHYNTVK